MRPTHIDFGDLSALAQSLHLLDEAHRRFRGHLARNRGLSSTELTALILLADAPGLSPGALARDLIISTGAMTAMIDRLEHAGHLRRLASTVDRRRLELHLTAPGRQTLAQLRDEYEAVLGGADTDDALISVLPQIDRVRNAIDQAARENSASRSR